MANGIYGTKRPAKITANDVDIYYYYRPTRSSESPMTGFQRLDSNILNTMKTVGDEVLNGMYDLRLPLDKFNQVGIYTVYIKPKEVKTSIYAVSTLSAYPNIRGIVLNLPTEITNLPTDNGELVGYRVEYFDDNGKREDMFRIITSNNKCEPLAQNMTNVHGNNVSFRFNDNSTLIFCTLTPSTNMSFDSASTPSIGKPGQEIVLVNTKFNPIMLEIEITEHDIETLSTMIEGEQLRNLDHGLITTFNEDGEIYHQSDYGTAVDSANNTHHDYKINRGMNINIEEIDVFKDIKDSLNR
jgi:hypothetical protein